jgi:phage replication-related protein YjqB (UPF0714/DUF867 family)
MGEEWQTDRIDLAELLSLPGVDEACVLGSAVGFMALHGGSQDRGTDHIARQAAEQTGASYYAIVQPSGLRVHLTSRLHDPDQSELLGTFLRHVKIAISVHGFGRDGFLFWINPEQGPVIDLYGPPLLGGQTGPLRGIILGGRNAGLLGAARGLFHERLAGYHLADERVRLGFHPDNPVNLPLLRGIQVELPPGLRGIGDFGEHLVPREDEMVAATIGVLIELAAFAGELINSAVVS